MTPTRLRIDNRVLFVFLDGVGLGDGDAGYNPLIAAGTPFLDGILGGRLSRDREPFRSPGVSFKRLDTTLGVLGLPQSATGQTALLTGKNGAALMNRHYGPWPGPSLKALLNNGTLFSEVAGAGGRVTLANAYPPPFFEALAAGRGKLNVPVFSASAAGLRLRTVRDYASGEGVSADLSGSHFHKLEAALPLYGPERAGEQLARLASLHHFTFFDFWLADAAGHRWPFSQAVALVETLDRFFAGLVPALGATTLVVTSDHGNLEDKRQKSHTLSPVPLLVVGEAGAFAGAVTLLDVAPAIRRTLGLPL